MSEQGAQPKTWFSGDSSPEDSRGVQTGLWIGSLAFFIASPVSVLVAFLSYFAFTKGRISHRVIAGTTALLTAALAVTGLLITSAMGYPQTIADLVDAIASGSITVSTVMDVLSRQLPVSLVLGGIIGSMYCWWRWFRRPAWEEFEFRLTPIQWMLKRKRINDIRNDRNAPKDGARLGITYEGKEIIQSDKEASAHTMYFGASGAGKTTTMATQVRDHIRRGHGVIIVDLKGSPEFAEIAAEYANRYGRPFQHWTFHDPRQPYTGPAEGGPSSYDPLGRGDASRRKDMVINMRTWTEDYYKSLASSYLQTAFEVMIASPAEPGVDAFSDIIAMLTDPALMVKRSYNMPEDSYHDRVREYVHGWTGGIDQSTGRLRRRLEKNELSAIGGTASDLQVIKGSSGGLWLRRGEDDAHNIDLLRAAYEGQVIVFTLDALTYPTTAPLIANLIIEDLKTVTSDLMANRAQNPLHVFIDEFSALDSQGVTGLINKSRSAGMPVTLATQALGDLRRVDETFLEQLLGICNSFVIHRANTYEDAEVLAGLIGKDMQWKVRLGVEHTSGMFGMMGRGAATGTGMVDRVEDYIVSPSDIQNLEAGEIIYLAKSPKQRIENVTVIPERTDLTSDGVSSRTTLPRHTEINPTPPTQQESLYLPGSKTPELPQTPAPTKPLHPNEDIQHVPQPVAATPEQPAMPHVTPRPSSGFLEGRDLHASMGGSKRTTPRPTPQQPTAAPVVPKKMPLPTRTAPAPQPAAPRPLGAMQRPTPTQQTAMPRPQRDAALPLPKKPAPTSPTRKPTVPGAPARPSATPAQPSSEWDDERW